MSIIIPLLSLSNAVMFIEYAYMSISHGGIGFTLGLYLSVHSGLLLPNVPMLLLDHDYQHP